ncbi:serine recombinase, partial [Klebsiella pneumoniae]
NMMLDMPAAIARKYYQDRLMRQIQRKKEKGKRQGKAGTQRKNII